MKPALFVNKTKNYSQIIEDILYAFPNALTEKEPVALALAADEGRASGDTLRGAANMP